MQLIEWLWLKIDRHCSLEDHERRICLLTRSRFQLSLANGEVHFHWLIVVGREFPGEKACVQCAVSKEKSNWWCVDDGALSQCHWDGEAVTRLLFCCSVSSLDSLPRRKKSSSHWLLDELLLLRENFEHSLSPVQLLQQRDFLCTEDKLQQKSFHRRVENVSGWSCHSICCKLWQILRETMT